MMKIAVYYIVTGEYKRYFNEFLKSLPNFFPSAEKHLILMADEEIPHDEANNVTVTYHHINHYPWPIITLYKHWHILQHFDNTCDYHCYFNANSIINTNNPSKWCDFNKLNVSYHSFSNIPEPLPSRKCSFRLKKESSAYLIPGSYEYIQGGFFFANTDITLKFCNDIINMINQDSKKQLYAEWHDESYANKWCVDNKKSVNRKFIMTIHDKYLSDTTFVKLPLKPEKIVKEFKRL